MLDKTNCMKTMPALAALRMNRTGYGSTDRQLPSEFAALNLVAYRYSDAVELAATRMEDESRGS